MVNDIVGEAVNQPTAEEKERERLRKILGETRIRTDTVVPDLEYALEVDGTGFFARRDIHAVKAKAKAGKTTTLKVFIAALLQGEMFRVKSLLEKPRIVFFDTEQNRKDTKSILDDVAAKTGPAVKTIKLLAQSTGEFTRDELKKDAKLAWTDKTKAEIAAAKGETAGTTNGSGGSNTNPTNGGGSNTGGNNGGGGDDDMGQD